ncbi:MAG: alginate lyase family protein [Rhizobiales bacterium]|nr:alginate lyase family protein [Hyphomicrobiales bacterium]
MIDIPRLLRTLAYMRPGQVINRVLRMVPRRIDLRPTEPPVRRQGSVGGWAQCSGRAPALVGPDRISLLGLEGDISTPGIWTDTRFPRLWLYHLHYFDDLLAGGASGRRAEHADLIERWIKENPPLAGAGWEPYPLSRRIPNWIAWALGGGPLSDAAAESLFLQARVLAATLEWHLLGNHLFANARALVFAGVFFDGREADAWLKVGLSILDAECQEQILADGAHFELSPMYHAITLEDLTDLVQLSRLYPASHALAARRDVWIADAGRMMTWLSAMTHPDGEVAFFNDSTFAQARPPSAVIEYAAAMGCGGVAVEEPLTHLPNSGYIRLARGPWFVLFDVAHVGPTYIPGHAHADTLSFELSLGRQRVVSNSGISTYAIGEMREWERSTAAHATVEIAGKNSSEIWGSFRVGRRARPFGIEVKTCETATSARGAHDGYRFLPGRPVHSREIEIDGLRVFVRDRVSGGDELPTVGRLPLHPDIAVENSDAHGWRIRTPDGHRIQVTVRGAQALRLDEGTFGCGFGICRSRAVLCWTLRGEGSVETEFAFEIKAELRSS